MMKNKEVALPDKDKLRKYLWREFLRSPGVFEKLREQIEHVKSLPEPDATSSSETLIASDNDIVSDDVTCCEDEFQPSSESSRISLSGEPSNCDKTSSDLSKSVNPASPSLHLDLPSSENDESKSAKVPVIRIKAEVNVASPVTPRLPPQSPRIQISQDEEEQTLPEAAFYMESNIDLVPERNIASPRNDESLKVSVIRYQNSRSRSPSLVEDVPITPEPGKGSNLTNSFVSPCISPYLASCFITQPESPLISQSQSSSISPENSTLDDEVADLKLDNQFIPPFYVKRCPTPVLSSELINSIQASFSNLPGGRVTEYHSFLSQFLEISPYFNSTIYKACYGDAESGNCGQFVTFLQINVKLLLLTNPTEKAFHILAGCKRTYLIPQDFHPLLETYLSTNPHLAFFRQEEFHHLHSSFIEAITASLFYSAGAWRTKKMHLRQFNQIKLLESLELIERGENPNYMDHFSYDQFYVFFVKLVQLDIDKSGFLSLEDFLDHDEGRISRRLATRIFQLNTLTGRQMNLWDWVVFMLADIDKSSPTSMEYWFPVLDIFNSGHLSVKDLKLLYHDNLILLVTSDYHIAERVSWADIQTQFVDLMGSDQWSLMSMKTKASEKLSHLLESCLNIFKFYAEDENEVSTQSGFSNIQNYVIIAMDEME